MKIRMEYDGCQRKGWDTNLKYKDRSEGNMINVCRTKVSGDVVEGVRW